ncbi:MAG: putative short chain dehydrogenase [Pseudonocardiales bacterium]|nr:putative short chain dehydrogenase [Pseudonocardiales bacterium]
MKIEAGSVAVVTGAASGIGLALAQAFGGRGLDVVMTDVRPSALEAAAHQLRATGARVLPVVVDVRSEDEVAALALRTMNEFGRVDIVCNNAGVSPDPGPMWVVPMAMWRWTLDVALMGVIHGIHAFAPHLVAQNRGHIVNTASVGGLTTLPGMGPYNAAKHAVVGLSESLKEEFERYAPAVGVSVLCPGLVDTGLPNTSRVNRPDAAALEQSAAEVSMAAMAGPGRTILSPATVAEMTISAMEANQMHIITHPDSRSRIVARIDSVLADLPD